MTQSFSSQAADRVRSLDGLRCLSILAVVVAHTALYEGLEGSPTKQFIYEYGRSGVSLFFVISGFLITSLLLAEKDNVGTVHIRSFYLRRVFRIMPAYFAMLAVVAIIGAVPPRSLLISALFMRDYGFGADDFALSHTWSLGVEEKFYLLWPFAVLAFSRRTLRDICIALLVCGPFIRVGTYFLAPDLRNSIAENFHTRFDTIAIGCLLAIVWATPAFAKFCERAAGAAMGVTALFVLFVMSPTLTTLFGGRYTLPFGLSFDTLACACVLICGIRAQGWVGDLLNWRPVMFVGVLSYSIYLWQQLALDPELSWPGSLGTRLCLLVGCALISYFVIERSFIGLRKRWREPLGRALSTELNPAPPELPSRESLSVGS
jgi:peptidoglycan/LPS O-acetylase OafA/YrhL